MLAGYDVGPQPGMHPPSSQTQRFSELKSGTQFKVNALCRDYLRNTPPARDRAFLRPRFPGHIHFQDRPRVPIREYMRDGADVHTTRCPIRIDGQRLYSEEGSPDLGEDTDRITTELIA